MKENGITHSHSKMKAKLAESGEKYLYSAPKLEKNYQTHFNAQPSE